MEGFIQVLKAAPGPSGELPGFAGHPGAHTSYRGELLDTKDFQI